MHRSKGMIQVHIARKKARDFMEANFYIPRTETEEEPEFCQVSEENLYYSEEQLDGLPRNTGGINAIHITE